MCKYICIPLYVLFQLKERIKEIHAGSLLNLQLFILRYLNSAYCEFVFYTSKSSLDSCLGLYLQNSVCKISLETNL